MGTVFLAVTPDDRAVAVKVLRSDLGNGLSDAESRLRFSRELAALQRVRGPHLVEVLDADVEADRPYIVTRFVNGRRLDEVVLQDGPLDEAALLRVARGVASGLATLHAVGIVHRDLTPGNVLLDDGEPHVIDLGLALAADVTAMTRSGAVLGTPGYLAPEQVVGTACTTAVDVHAWGATVALAGTGRPPYGTGRPEAVLYRVVHDRPDLAGLPPALAPLVERATARDPAERPTARELERALGGRSGVEPVTVVLPRGTAAEQALTTRLEPAVLLAALGTDGRDRPEEQGRSDARDGADVRSGTEIDGAAYDGEALGGGSGTYDNRPYAGGTSGNGTYADGTHDGGTHDGGADTDPGTQLRTDSRTDPGTDRGTDRGTESDTDVDLARHGDLPLAAPAERTPAVRGGYVTVTGALGLVVTAAAACVRPVLVALLALALVVAVQAGARASAAREVRQARRGDRRRDAAVSALALPWHAVRAAGDVGRALPLGFLLVGPPAAAVALFVRDAPGRSTPGAAAVAVAVVGGLLVVLCRRDLGRARRRLRRGALALAPDPGRTAGVVVGLAVLAVLALAAAEQVSTSWWPLSR